jgi:cystathionine beta-lyase/cystathionine gamma-synthase
MVKKKINSSRTPLYRDAGFELSDAESARAAFKRESESEREPDIYIYSRYRNPTVNAAEEEIMKLEGCMWALLSQSGMSAIDIAVSVFQRNNSTAPFLFFSDIYGGTLSYIDSVLKKRRGIDVRLFNPDENKYDTDKFEKVLKETKPEFVYIETISNPMLIVVDFVQVIKSAHAYGSKVIVDNTFATPYICKPLDSGADLVIHSATKYLSGHGNITAGVLCGNDSGLMRSAIEYRKFTGHMLSPDDAYRLHTQLQTFNLRFRQQCTNAFRLANILNNTPGIRKVLYPGLENHPTYPEAVRLFGEKGFGAIITFDFDGNGDTEKRSRRDRFIEAVSDKIKIIPSLGDSNTILLPVESVWGEKYPEPGMIRLSVGVEDYPELESTILNGLGR